MRTRSVFAFLLPRYLSYSFLFPAAFLCFSFYHCDCRTGFGGIKEENSPKTPFNVFSSVPVQGAIPNSTDNSELSTRPLAVRITLFCAVFSFNVEYFYRTLKAATLRLRPSAKECWPLCCLDGNVFLYYRMFQNWHIAD
jgi:hypothetical protein